MTTPYMPLFVADYLADTAHLSAAEHGAYLMLIMNYWQRGKALPDDDRKLARIARMTDAEWAEVKPSIIDFFLVVGGEWRHSRIDKEIAIAVEKSAKAKAAARASVAARSTDAQRTLNGRSTDVELLGEDREVREVQEDKSSFTLSASALPSLALVVSSESIEKPKSAKPPKSAPVEYPSAFTLLWDCYPRVPNQSKSEAFKSWKRLGEHDRMDLLSSVGPYEEFLERERRRRPDYPACHLVTFINQRRWESLLEPKCLSKPSLSA